MTNNTHSFYYPQIPIYNPFSYSVDLSTYTIDANGLEFRILLTIPANEWRMVPDHYLTREEALSKGLVVDSTDAGPSVPTTPTYPIAPADDASKNVYEEYVLLTSAIIERGFFEIIPQIADYHWDSTEFLPEGGVQQIYGTAYTIVNTAEGKSRVIFNKNVFGGPSVGLQDLLEAGEHVSFRYHPN